MGYKMKKLLLIIFALLFFNSIFLVSATVNQVNEIKYGIIENDGSLTTTNSSITDSNVIGFVCLTSDCSQVGDQMFNGSVLNTGADSFFNLIFPTQLQSQGYGLFFYKDNYFPYEVKAT